jgi:hypothetical protein
MKANIQAREWWAWSEGEEDIVQLTIEQGEPHAGADAQRSLRWRNTQLLNTSP